jgi:hypothetical protein
MKKRIPVMMMTLIILLVAGLQAEAKIWRVNNNANATNGSNLGGTVSFPVFQQLFGTAANSANSSNLVLPGDTVHMEGSTIDYNGGNLTKKLVIIGPGYFLNENPNTSNNVLSAIIENVYFYPGSSGSQLIGMYIGHYSGGIAVYVSDILIKRCRIDYAIYLAEPTTSNINILQNFFSRATATSCITAYSGGFPSDVSFNYNIVLGTLVLPDGFTMQDCKNNVFAGPSIAGNPSLRMYVGSFQNNIMTNPAATTNINGVAGGSNPINVTYNTGSSAAQFGNGTGNIVVADMPNLLFVPSGTSDGKYQLRAGTATGSDGTTDRGAYGGLAVTSRYTLSGLPPIPVIYEINTSGVATPTGLDVIIKARTIK